MNIKRSGLAAAITAAIVMGASGQAAAYEYGRSQLFVDNLTVVLSDTGGAPGGGEVRSFDFNLINTAFLNGLGGASTGGCSGTIAANDCLLAPFAANAVVVNGTGSVPMQGENTFVINGPGAGSSYANGDSVVDLAALTGDAVTKTRQQAEAEINSGDASASASTEVGSNTGFLMTFTVAGENQLSVEMDALLNILAEINDPVATSAAAKSNTEVEFRLSNDTSGDFFTFRPDGAGTGECAASGGGLVCTTTADQFDLNSDVNVTGLPMSSSGRSNTAANDHFGVIFSGLTDGNWTLGLNAKTSTQLSRGEVPEPGILALMGIGFLGLGISTFRKRKKFV